MKPVVTYRRDYYRNCYFNTTHVNGFSCHLVVLFGNRLAVQWVVKESTGWDFEITPGNVIYYACFLRWRCHSYLGRKFSQRSKTVYKLSALSDVWTHIYGHCSTDTLRLGAIVCVNRTFTSFITGRKKQILWSLEGTQGRNHGFWKYSRSHNSERDSIESCG
jgi:hypothetical protein